MTITAKYPGQCVRCGRAIRPGQQIEWRRGQPPYHAACAHTAGTPAAALPRRKPVAGAAGGIRHAAGRNRQSGACERCGHYLAVGEGRLEWCVEDSGCRRHHDEGGYHLYCLDGAACTARREAALAAARAEQERIAAREALISELEQLARASERYADAEATRRRPKGQEVVLDPGVHGSGRRVAILADDGTVAVWCGGYYDDYRPTLALTHDPRAAEIVRLLAAPK